MERRAVWALAAAGALAGAFADARPSDLLLVDVLLRAAWAALVTLAASRARRAPLVVMSGIAATAADGAALVGIATAGLLVALFTAVADRRGRLFGALIGVASVNVLLRLPPSSTHGVSALLAGIAVAPVLWSGYRNAPRAHRKRFRTGLFVTSGVVGALTLLFGVALLEARAHVERGIADARTGLAAIRRGDRDLAIARFDDASQSFSEAHSAAGSWWAQPARLVPLLGQHLRAISTVTDAGADLADTAATASTRADVRTLDFTAGAIDLELVSSFRDPLQQVVTALTEADDRIGDVRSPWLVAPLQDRINGLADDIDSALPQAETALQAVTVAPDLLGGTQTRRYFVAFITPSELRGLGGFMGNYGELTAEDGKISLIQSGRTGDLRPKLGEPLPTLVAPDDYVARYGPLLPNLYLQDIPLSPDFPTVASVFEGIYPQVGGQPVDGVIALDPYALAALLKYTGPISIAGLDEPLTSRNAADLLLRRQYTEFPNRSERVDFLDEATRVTFERLTNSDLPDPRQIANDLGPLVAQGRLMAQSIHPAEQELFERVGLANAYPPVGSGDFFGITTQNSGNNKIDIFLSRDVKYEATYDPSTGGVDAVATIALRNSAPAAGLPANVIGNTANLPLGTNQLFLTVYSPLVARTWAIDGDEIPFNAQTELGRNAYATLVDIPPGKTVTVTVHLTGGIGPSTTYRLVVAHQPMITPDRVQVAITPAGGARFSDGDGFKVDGSLAETTFEQQTDVVLTARLRR